MLRANAGWRAVRCQNNVPKRGTERFDQHAEVLSIVSALFRDDRTFSVQQRTILPRWRAMRRVALRVSTTNWAASTIAG